MALEVIIEILCVAAQIEHDAPDQRAAGQARRSWTLRRARCSPRAWRPQLRSSSARDLSIWPQGYLLESSPLQATRVEPASTSRVTVQSCGGQVSPSTVTPASGASFSGAVKWGRAGGSSGTSGSSNREVFGPPSHNRSRHRIRRRPNHRPQRIRNRQANAMAVGKDPTGDVQLDRKHILCDSASRSLGLRGGIALRAALPCTGD